MPDSHVRTYHCICNELILALFSPLEALPKRRNDGARICKISSRSDVPIPTGVVLSGSTLQDDSPVVLKLEDGFEKRYFVQCTRCDLKIGYRLDKSQFGEAEGFGVRADVLYLLPGGLLSTDDMKAGRKMDSEDIPQEKVAG